VTHPKTKRDCEEAERKRCRAGATTTRSDEPEEGVWSRIQVLEMLNLKTGGGSMAVHGVASSE
jgi:hypothetical protein